MQAVLTSAAPTLPKPASGIVFSMPEGLPGFEPLHEWHVVTHADARPFFWIESAVAPALGEYGPQRGIRLLLADPQDVTTGYEVAFSRTDLARVGLGPADPRLVYLVVTLRDGGATVNLRAPLVVNPATRVAAQVILEDTAWPLRHPLVLPDAD